MAPVWSFPLQPLGMTHWSGLVLQQTPVLLSPQTDCPLGPATVGKVSTATVGRRPAFTFEGFSALEAAFACATGRGFRADSCSRRFAGRVLTARQQSMTC